jgi:hypothetical protein
MAWKSVTGAVIGSGIALTLTAVAAPIVLPVIGFSTGGVVAGSMAAAAQSAIGNVAGKFLCRSTEPWSRWRFLDGSHKCCYSCWSCGRSRSWRGSGGDLSEIKVIIWWTVEIQLASFWTSYIKCLICLI